MCENLFFLKTAVGLYSTVLVTHQHGRLRSIEQLPTRIDLVCVSVRPAHVQDREYLVASEFLNGLLRRQQPTHARRHRQVTVAEHQLGFPVAENECSGNVMLCVPACLDDIGAGLVLVRQGFVST